MSSRPAEIRTVDFGIVMRATATVRTNSSASSFAPLASGRALDLHQHIGRYAFRMHRQAGERRDHADAILRRFAHADDAAAAGIDAGRAHSASVAPQPRSAWPARHSIYEITTEA
jgi:hypothetical protein